MVTGKETEIFGRHGLDAWGFEAASITANDSEVAVGQRGFEEPTGFDAAER